MRAMAQGLSCLLASAGTVLLFCGVLMAPQPAFAAYTTAGCGNGTCHHNGTYCTLGTEGCTGNTACGCNSNLIPQCNCNQST
jgi:hypothetical protein